MKKLIYCALALAAGLFAASCQQENLEPVAQENTVTYTVEVPGVDTKAIGDGQNVDQLVYEVWKTGEDGVITDKSTRLYQKTINLAPDAPRKWIVTLNLVQNQTYKALFWAQVGKPKGHENYNTDQLTNVYYAYDVTKDYSSNQEAYAAFYGTDVLDTNTPLKGKTITLTRPFAQLNIGTLNTALEDEYTVKMEKSSVKVTVPTQFNAATSTVANLQEITFALADVPTDPAVLPVSGTEYQYAAMNYVFAGENTTSSVEYTINTTITPTGSETSTTATIKKTIPNVPLKENYRTNIVGNLLTSSAQYEVVIDKDFNDQADEFEGGKYGVIDGKQYIRVVDINEFNAAVVDENVDIIILQDNIELTQPHTRAATDPTITISEGKELTIDLNDKTLTGNFTPADASAALFDVRGTLNVENGTVIMNREDAAFNANYRTTVFLASFNGVVNLNGVTAKNIGGAGMAYVCDMSNATNATLNVENSTLESSYIAVRIFNNNKDGIHNATIKNSTLKGKYCFWVQYHLGDGYTQEILDRQLNLDIYKNENTLVPAQGKLPILFGFNSYVYANGDGITKSVSEDGTEVTLGSLVEDGLIRRGVAGDEENTTIKKVVVGEGVTTLYDRTFRRFYALETVELPSTLETIGAAGSGVFQSCTALKNIVLPVSVTVLGKGTFNECSSLESINIPVGVTRIEEDCLRATGLKKVEFHEGVTYFGAQAFRDCKQLKEVIINAPSFTVEANAFGVMAGTLPGTTIYVANEEMKAYLENTLAYKNQFTIVAPEVVDNTVDLQAALNEGNNVNLSNDLTISSEEMITAPYGNKTALVHNGGVFNGNGNTLSVTAGGDNYVVMTNGGTIKNLNIDNGFRGIVIMYANQAICLDNVVSSGNVCYALNTAEGDSTQDLVATNCTFDGWSSWSLLKSATFKNCSFGQGQYNTDVSGRLGKPYVKTVFEGCNFCSKYYIDLSALIDGHVVTLKNCSVNGIKITAQNWAEMVAPESTCGENQITVELKNATYLSETNIADYIVFE